MPSVYRLEVERQARKSLLRLPPAIKRRIEVKIDALAEDPRPAGCEPVQRAPKGTYRVRVGDYRVVYVVWDEERLIIVARVSKGDEGTYRGL